MSLRQAYTSMTSCNFRIASTLLALGHSLIIVEHNLQLMKAADCIIDIGPGAADEGGTVIAQGTPEELTRIEESHTGRFLRDVLDIT